MNLPRLVPRESWADLGAVAAMAIGVAIAFVAAVAGHWHWLAVGTAIALLSALTYLDRAWPGPAEAPPAVAADLSDDEPFCLDCFRAMAWVPGSPGYYKCPGSGRCSGRWATMDTIRYWRRLAKLNEARVKP